MDKKCKCGEKMTWITGSEFGDDAYYCEFCGRLLYINGDDEWYDFKQAKRPGEER